MTQDHIPPIGIEKFGTRRGHGCGLKAMSSDILPLKSNVLTICGIIISPKICIIRNACIHGSKCSQCHSLVRGTSRQIREDIAHGRLPTIIGLSPHKIVLQQNSNKCRRHRLCIGSLKIFNTEKVEGEFKTSLINTHT